MKKVSNWMASKHFTFSNLSWKDVLKNNDKKTLKKNTPAGKHPCSTKEVGT
jgi:hypothetical protein